MSYFIVRCLCPHYEDYDPYGIERNAVQGFPELWEPERYAEGALYEEFKAMREQAALMRRYRKATPACPDHDVQVRALISLAKDGGWQLKNEWSIKQYGVSPIYKIPPREDNEPAPTRWNAYVRWLDWQMSKEEEREAKRKEMEAEREAKSRSDNRITLDYAALSKMMGDMMSDIDIIASLEKPRQTKIPRKDAIVHALVMLADESEWKRLNVQGYCGTQLPKAYRIR